LQKKSLRFYENYGVPAWTGGEGSQFLWFSADVFYGRRLFVVFIMMQKKCNKRESSACCHLPCTVVVFRI